MGAWDRTQDDLIQQNEVAPDPDVIPVPVDDEVAPDEDEDEFFDAALKFTQNMEATRPTQEGRREGGLTTLKIEIEKYLDLPRLTNPKVDVLG
jgi:hypothetical protein